MFNKHITLLLCACALLCTQSITAYLVWPISLFNPISHYPWLLIGISILIETTILYLYLKNNYSTTKEAILKSFLMSLTGNAVMSLLEWFYLVNKITFLMNVSGIETTILWLPLTIFIDTLIKIFTINLIFKYPTKKLWAPILISNLINYALIIIAFIYILSVQGLS